MIQITVSQSRQKLLAFVDTCIRKKEAILQSVVAAVVVVVVVVATTTTSYTIASFKYRTVLNLSKLKK